MESDCQSENDVGVEDWADDDEYNSSDGELGGGIDEEIMDNEEGSEFDGELDMSSTDENGSEQEDCDAEKININCMADISKIDMNNISGDEVERYYFADLETAYNFYCCYGRATGFSVRKSHVVKNVAGEVVQQTFLCSREGYKEYNGLTPEKRKREQKNETRCGCGARFRVHIDIVTRCWYVTLFVFVHNHALLDDTMCGQLPAHRKMTETDASAALKYLYDLRRKDQLMFVAHKVDNDNRLERLFWCDGESRKNFEVFGDVLAFDATYRKNKHNCPFVVFSGVNHHNQTIVFAAGLVTRETEETYVWLLEQFVCAMHGKSPISVITNDDIAMKNAIRKMFPKAHHGLCAWHLLRNASTNVGIPGFMRYLKQCMLGDIEVSEAMFEEIWGDMVKKFGLEDNSWITEMYAKRKMWSTAHTSGFFFAGLRTTSRCEALHSHLRQFVHSRINLLNFVQQFQRCLTCFRFREIKADFRSNYGQPVIQSGLRSIENSAANQYTKEIFNMFKVFLDKSMLLKVLDSHQISSCCIYKVAKYCGNGDTWYVSHSENSMEKFRCSCLSMESIGLPCDHIVCLLEFLDIDELPKCLVLPRWTKIAKDSIIGSYPGGSLYWDSQVAGRYSSLEKMSKEVAELVYDDLDDYNRVVDVLNTELKRLKAKHKNVESGTVDVNVLDPPQVRTKGFGHNKRFRPNSNTVAHPALTPSPNYDYLGTERGTSI